MSSFINFNNKNDSAINLYSAEVIKEALLISETKSPIKATKIVEDIKEPVALNEALNLFTDKLTAVKSLSSAIIIVNEGRVKQFEMDFKDMVNDIKKGYGWIDPEYVAQTWDNSSDSIDFSLVRDEIFDRLIDAGLLAHPDSSNPEKAGKKLKSAKELYAFENNETTLEEGKSITKIQKEYGQVVKDMVTTVEEWKAAEGDRKAELLEKLRALTAQKKDLLAQLDDAVGLKDVHAELAESVVTEALSKEQKMVETFLNKIAKEFDYSIQDAVRFVKETISKMRLDESVVTEKKEEKDEAAEIEAEIEKLTKENKHGYAKDIKRLKVRLSAVNMMKKFNKNNESVVTEAKNDGNLDTIADYVKQVLDDGKSFMDIGKKLKGSYKYDFSTGMMPMYIIPVSGNKIVIINKKYVENGQADRVVGDIAIGLMESMVTEAKGFKNDEDFEEFLKEIDAMPERAVRKIMGKEYIDTPGFYQDEKDDYDDVIDFMISNMGANIYHQLEQWWELNVMKPGLRESKIQIKRRYTDNHPAQTSGRTAKVRNAMIEALADGVLTEEEFNNILKEKSIDNKRWMRRNSKYFTVSENGIGLSKFGKRILTGIKPVVSLTLESFINEANYIKFKGKKVDISSLEMEDVDMKDYPDFSDAYFSYGEYSNGKEMTDEELSDFTDDNGDLANELAHDSLH